MKTTTTSSTIRPFTNASASQFEGKSLRFWITIYELTYPYAGIGYVDGVRYLMWHNDEVPRAEGTRPWFTYLVMPISCQEFKDLMRQKIPLYQVMDKHPFYRLYMDDIIGQGHDEFVHHAEIMPNGIADIGPNAKPHPKVSIFYLHDTTKPDFYK